MFVLDSEIGEQGIDILIGMDIINRGDFSVVFMDAVHFHVREDNRTVKKQFTLL